MNMTELVILVITLVLLAGTLALRRFRQKAGPLENTEEPYPGLYEAIKEEGGKNDLGVESER